MPDERGDVARPRGGALGLPEAVTLTVVAFGLVATWVLQEVWVGPMTMMFDDFGGQIPRVTRAAIQPVISLGGTVVIVPLAGLGVALRALGKRRRGTALIAVAALVAIVLPFALLGATYYGIFAVASVVR